MARISWQLRLLISRYQESFNVIEKVTLGAWQGIPPAHLSWVNPDSAPPVPFQCPKPVIAAIHGGCIGGGESASTTHLGIYFVCSFTSANDLQPQICC